MPFHLNIIKIFVSSLVFSSQSIKIDCKWASIMHDQFNDWSLNTDMWEVGNGTNVWSSIIKSSSPDNISLKNATLIIDAKENNGPKLANSTHLNLIHSNIYNSRGTWNQGRFEARAKLASGIGIYSSSIHLYSSQSDIQIILIKCEKSSNIQTNYKFKWHCKSGINIGSSNKLIGLLTFNFTPHPELDFNEYVLEWKNDSMKWFVNGISYWNQSLIHYYLPFDSTTNQSLFDHLIDKMFFLQMDCTLFKFEKDNFSIKSPLMVDFVDVSKWVSKEDNRDETRARSNRSKTSSLHLILMLFTLSLVFLIVILIIAIILVRKRKLANMEKMKSESKAKSSNSRKEPENEYYCDGESMMRKDGNEIDYDLEYESIDINLDGIYDVVNDHTQDYDEIQLT